MSLPAQSGALDVTFGSGGIVATDHSPGSDLGRSGIIQPDGKIIVCGSINSGLGFLLVRYHTSGIIDSTFGTNGIASTSFLGSGATATAIGRQPDGKLVVAGSLLNGATFYSAVARYDSLGFLDATFGSSGTVVQSIGGAGEVRDLALQGDGKILIAGTFRPGSTTFVGLRRYRANGQLDSAFGINGTVTRGPGIENACVGIRLRADGKIMAAGSTRLTSNDVAEFLLFRFKSNGTPDSTFGTVGRVTTSISVFSHYANSVYLTSTGTIIVGGHIGTAANLTHRFAAVRYTDTGAIDSSYGVSGVAITPEIGSTNGYAFANHALLLGSDKLLLTGQATLSSTSDDFAIVRLTAEGRMDSTFGSSGVVYTNIESNGRDVAFRLLQQADGKLLAVGQGGIGVFSGGARVSLVRYLMDELPPNTSTDLNIQNGWNMLSLPRDGGDILRNSIFPGAVAGAFEYRPTGYILRDTLATSVGYWLKFTSPQTIGYSGAERIIDTIDLNAGWNMIGSLTGSVPVDSISSPTIGMTLSNFYGYSGSYSVPDLIEPGKAYWVKATQAGQIILSGGGSHIFANAIRISPSEDPPPASPDESVSHSTHLQSFDLRQNFPNPFNPSTVIRYTLPEPSSVTLTIVDILGRKVALLVDGTKVSGDHSIVWDASGVTAGMYFCRIEARTALEGKTFVEVRKMLLMK